MIQMGSDVRSANLQNSLQRLLLVKDSDISVLLAPWVTAALVLLLAWSLADVTWRAVGLQHTGGIIVASPGRVVVEPTADTVHSLERVAALNLLGHAEAVPEEVIIAPPVDAPDTRLRLELKGVAAFADPSAGMALVAENTQSEARHYAVGALLPGGARLEQIFPDRVIILHQGRHETLRLPREQPPDVPSNIRSSVSPQFTREANASLPPLTPTPTTTQPSVTQELSERRDEWVQDPASFFNSVRVQPVMDENGLRGFAISPRRDARLFRELGLRPGDIITSVNGYPVVELADPTQFQTQLANAPMLSLEIERGGQTQVIDIIINP